MPTIYNLQIVLRAQQDIENIVRYLVQQRPSAAGKFVAALESNFARLYQSPARFPKIRERFRGRRTYRHILFYPYRIIFRIRHRTVFILRIMHQRQILREIE